MVDFPGPASGKYSPHFAPFFLGKKYAQYAKDDQNRRDRGGGGAWRARAVVTWGCVGGRGTKEKEDLPYEYLNIKCWEKC